MNALSRFGDLRLELQTPVKVFGKPGVITGKAFGHEHYDVRFRDGSVQHSIYRENIEIDFNSLRKDC